jgi:23S rRNA (adenine2503-C2)-methyltransferase
VRRINTELGIGAKRVTVSTVGIVPNIRKLYEDPDMPHVKLAVSLHCATDEERDELMPVNQRYGGIEELMKALDDYMEKTSRRISLEWGKYLTLRCNVSTSLSDSSQLSILFRVVQH